RFGLMAEYDMLDQARQVVRELGIRVPSLHTPVGRLSKGQQQAVAIARTLLGEPRIIVLDEPAATLSMTQTAELLGHVERLRNLGLGVLLISHNPQDVRAVADRVVVLRHGRNNGAFDGATVTNEELIAAITGAARHRD